MAAKTLFVTTDRLENFSDGVFTIVLTLLAFTFKVPKLSFHADFQKNFHELMVIGPYLIGFVFSFVFVAVFWVNHHHLYKTIKEANSKLIWYNIHFLFWVTMMPIVLEIVGDEPRVPLAAMSLGIVIFMAALSAYFLRRYCYVKSKLADQTLSHESVSGGLIKNAWAIAFALCGIFSALISVYVSYIIYFVVLGIFMIPQKLEKETGTRSNSSN